MERLQNILETKWSFGGNVEITATAEAYKVSDSV
jgi:hypothetical protein